MVVSPLKKIQSCKLKAVIQRVKEASVSVEGEVVSEIKKGLLVLIGLHKEDSEKDANWMIQKILNARIFENRESKFDYSVEDIKGEILVVSQFTLYGNMKKGKRPDFSESMAIDKARLFFSNLIEKFKQSTSCIVKEGKFQARMDVNSINEGPVTLILDSNS